MSEVRLYRVSGVVLRHRDLGEADRLVRLLTRERGKLSVVAKGAKRPKSKLASAVQPFTQSRLQIAVGRSLDIITQAQLVDSHYALRTDLTRLAYANHLSELVDAFLEEGQRSARVYDLHLGALRRLAAGEPLDLVARAFELVLLSLLGFGPQWETCASCGRAAAEDAAALSPTMGILCTRCRAADPSARALSTEGARLAQALSDRRRSAPPSASASVRRQLEQAMCGLLEFHLARPLRSARFIAGLSRTQGDEDK